MYICGICGSNDIEVEMWVNPNTMEINIDVDTSSDSCWCNNCGGHTWYKEEEDDDNTDEERKVSDEEGVP